MKKALLGILMWIVTHASMAGTIRGGQMYYDYLGDSTYYVTVTLERLCFDAGTTPENSITISVFDLATNQLVLKELPLLSTDQREETAFDTCRVETAEVCAVQLFYGAELSLEHNASGYRISYQECCREANLKNINDSSSSGLTLTTEIPSENSVLIQNSSPRFETQLPLMICSRSMRTLTFKATDPDGDSLSYHLSLPFDGGSTTNQVPLPASLAPYLLLQNDVGFSVQEPFGPTGIVEYNELNGLLEMIDTLKGKYLISVQVEEWRNDNLITITNRDMVLQVINCDDRVKVAIDMPTEVCITEDTVDIQGVFVGPLGTDYYWTFDASTNIVSNPVIDQITAVFSEGSNTVSLMGIYGDCAASISSDIYVFTEPVIEFDFIDTLQCFPFEASFMNASSAETPLDYFWEFGDGATSTDRNPKHLYPGTGTYEVRLTIQTDKGCVDTLTLTRNDLIDVKPSPAAGFTITPEFATICDSEIQFLDASEGTMTYHYIFDDRGQFYKGSEPNPTHEYTSEGTMYAVQEVTNEWGCKDQTSLEVVIAPNVVFVPNTFTPDSDELNNSFNASYSFSVENWHLIIFNRWGQLVFESYDPEIGWDGTFSGEMAKSGVYAYTIAYSSCGPVSSEQFISGHLNLIR